MADLTTHYKERTPEATVQLIKDFFVKHGLYTTESNCAESEAGTWYCRISLFYNNICIGGANGKGVNRSYALASGYAELYERFCNKIFFICGIIWNKAYIKESLKTRGYYFHPEEKQLTYDELINNSNRFKQYLEALSGGNEELKAAAIDYMTEGQYIGVPMKNIADENDKLYVDPRILMRVTRSNGMAAGNTVNEALVQGLSELVERHVSKKLFDELDSVPHYAIKLENIENPELQRIIHNIKDAGFDLYLFDMSYNYNMPTMMSLLVQPDYGFINMNFGAFPVFDIAAERVLTELYQGIPSYRSKENKFRLQTPYKSVSDIERSTTYANSISGELFPADFFKTIQYVDTYNHNVFVDKKVSNEELVNYFIKLGQQIGKFKFYYLDNSLCEDLAAVHIMMENVDENYDTFTALDLFDNNLTSIQAAQALTHLNLLKQVQTNFYNNRPIKQSDIVQLIQNDWLLDNKCFDYINNISLWNSMFIISRTEGGNYGLINGLLNSSNDIFIQSELVDCEFFTEYKKYMQLLLYVNCQQYTTEELLYIFNDIFHYNITEEDIQKCTIPAYLIQRGYIEPMLRFIHGGALDTIIKTYIPS